MFTKILCGPCGGHYRPIPGRPSVYRCVKCDHEVARTDLVMDEGESVTLHMGVLGYTVSA